MRRVGDRLREAREERAKIATVRTAARQIGIQENQLSAYERGDTMPEPWTLKKLCAYYGVSSDWVLHLGERPDVRGSGGVINLAVERAVLEARSFEAALAAATSLQAVTGGAIIAGNPTPQEYEVLGEEEFSSRMNTISIRLNNLKKRRAGGVRKDGSGSDGRTHQDPDK